VIAAPFQSRRNRRTTSLLRSKGQPIERAAPPQGNLPPSARWKAAAHGCCRSQDLAVRKMAGRLPCILPTGHTRARDRCLDARRRKAENNRLAGFEPAELQRHCRHVCVRLPPASPPTRLQRGAKAAIRDRTAVEFV